MTRRCDRWALTAARIGAVIAVTGVVVPELAVADPDDNPIGRPQSVANRGNKSMDLLRYLLTQYKAYELETTDGRARRAERVHNYRAIERFMTWVSDPTRFAPSREVAEYVVDPRNQWEIKSTLGDFAAALGAETIVETGATEGAYHLLLEAAGYVVGVSLGGAAFVVAPVVGMPNDLGQQPHAHNPSPGQRHTGVAGGHDQGLSTFDEGQTTWGFGGSHQSAPGRSDDGRPAANDGSSQNSSSGSSYRPTTHREPEHRDNQHEQRSSADNRREGGPTKGPDRPNEPKRPSVEGRVDEGSGLIVRSYRPGDDPARGDRPYHIQQLPLDEQHRHGNGNDVGNFRLPSGARDNRSGLTRMDVRSTTGRSPFEVKTGAADDEKKRPESQGRQPDANNTNDLGNDLPFRRRHVGGNTAPPLAESLWWERNGPRAQPPK